MIMQRFIPIEVYIDDMLEQCFDGSFQSFFNSTLDIDFSDLDSMLFKSENDMFLRFEELAQRTNRSEINDTITKFSDTQKLFLVICFDLIRLYPSKNTQFMPAFPIEYVYKNFFAFAQFSYERFKKDCFLKNVSFSESWTDLRHQIDDFDSI